MSILSELKMWTTYRCTLEFTSQCIGGTPSAKNMIEGWLKTKNIAASEEKLKELVDATAAELGAKVDEEASAMWTTFKIDKKGAYLEGRQLKAMFKESANILRDLLIKLEGKKKSAKGEERSRFTNLKSRVAERLFVVENQIYFMRDGKNILLADGSDERPIHVQTAMGPRTALKRSDYMLPGTQVSFTVKHLNDGVVDEEMIRVLLEHSSLNGLGADRSQGFGTFKLNELVLL